MQTTSGEDVRDFTRLLRNKLMSSKKKKSSRLGYLPVQNLEPETPDSPSLSPGRSVSRQVREREREREREMETERQREREPSIQREIYIHT